MTIRCEIVSQDRTVFAGDVDIIVLPGADGEMGVLPKHAPVLTTLKYGIIKVRRKVKRSSSPSLAALRKCSLISSPFWRMPLRTWKRSTKPAPKPPANVPKKYLPRVFPRITMHILPWKPPCVNQTCVGCCPTLSQGKWDENAHFGELNLRGSVFKRPGHRPGYHVHAPRRRHTGAVGTSRPLLPSKWTTRRWSLGHRSA
jgi:hypothetical protein